MKQLERTGFLIVAGLLILLLALFPFLTIDSISKLLARRAFLDPGNFALIFYLEISRVLTTVTALLAGLVLIVRSSGQPDGRALTLFLVFVGLTYEKIFGGTGFPGPMQEALTAWLLGNGVPRGVLIWLFGPVPWTIWLALAAMMRFSVVFPRPPLSAEIIDASAVHDRKGMMRGAGFAGLDIGLGFRRISKRLLAAGAYRPLPVWTTAIALIALTTLLARGARIVLFGIVASAVAALVITNLRASYNVVAPAEKARMRWLMLGFAVAGSLFLVASVPLLFIDEPVATVPALVLLMVAPAVIMIAMAMAVIYRGPADAGQLLAELPRWTVRSLVLLLILGAVTALLRAAGMPGGLAILLGAIVAFILFRPSRSLSDHVVNRVLERPAR
jgi:hypothetical protein